MIQMNICIENYTNKFKYSNVHHTLIHINHIAHFIHIPISSNMRAPGHGLSFVFVCRHIQQIEIQMQIS